MAQKIAVIDYDPIRATYSRTWESLTNATNFRLLDISLKDVVGDHNLEIVCRGMNDGGELTLDLFRKTPSPTGLGLYFTEILRIVVHVLHPADLHPGNGHRCLDLETADVVETRVHLEGVARVGVTQVADLHGEEKQRQETCRHEGADEDLELVLGRGGTIEIVVDRLVLKEGIERRLTDSLETALALAAYGLGLPAFVLQKVLQPLYFAREDTRSPFRFALVDDAVVVKIGGPVS